MSLKAFHIVFIVMSTVLSLGFGAWALTRNLAGGSSMYLLVAAGAVAAAAGLAVYGIWFLRKLRHVSYL
jgi:hypothetical protein